ncbi:hypothetical protein L6452_22285 [Arctium lappa]|uniref:Uncharacterized protein n=1 Tax=Arctium lappa TaxID=4217 RepID=A0ACB9B007_ARCLA|nr:hypothetical protein L6452_22285 [Arctium lappa]
MMTTTSIEEDGSSKIAFLTPGMKEILHQSILHYLHRSGFSKTLKRFQSEAQIQNDMWKASSANLEDIYCKYINACHHSEVDVEGAKKDGRDVCFVHEKTTKSKKKKKGSDEGDKGATEDQSRATMSNGDIPEDNVVAESEIKAKKKKNKHDLASCGETEEAKSSAPKKPVDDTMNGLEANESKKKPKDKKRKSNQQEVCTKVKPLTSDTEKGEIHPDVAKEEKKSSKKRKRLLSDEIEDQSAKMETNQTLEESKRQKTEASKEDKVGESGAHGTSDKQINEHGNEKPEINGGDKSGSQKSVRKQCNGSAEPKTINAFQRVKIDQVEFAHEKLQDNSYWAKDGADVGYGAKAQEVLGQVRGRDFRHEKTKKKRGSYRGGQIDLHSHSIKFNYSDEE